MHFGIKISFCSDFPLVTYVTFGMRQKFIGNKSSLANQAVSV